MGFFSKHVRLASKGNLSFLSTKRPPLHEQLVCWFQFSLCCYHACSSLIWYIFGKYRVFNLSCIIWKALNLLLSFNNFSFLLHIKKQSNWWSKFWICFKLVAFFSKCIRFVHIWKPIIFSQLLELCSYIQFQKTSMEYVGFQVAYFV